MAEIKENGLYLGSWEYMYMGTSTPNGLPNQLFSEDAHLLVVFENIYCDENGLRGEKRAFDELKWTNSRLFCDFSRQKYGIIKGLPIKSEIQNRISNLRIENGFVCDKDFQKEIEKTEIEQLISLKYALLQPFLATNRLITYDVDFNITIQELTLKTPHIYLTKKMKDLTSVNYSYFKELQKSERNSLLELRKGIIQQEEYYSRLNQNKKLYREIDKELIEGYEERFENILRYRERFSKRGGWNYVQEYFKMANSVVDVDIEELTKLQKQIQICLDNTKIPVISELGYASWNITKSILGFIPYVGEVLDAKDVINSIKSNKKVFSDFFSFFKRK